MINLINDGGPAFPSVIPENHKTGPEHCPGMSLLDWFAAQETLTEWDHPEAEMSPLMMEALAGEEAPAEGWGKDPLGMLKWDARARAALKYIRAEAMVAEREKRILKGL